MKHFEIYLKSPISATDLAKVINAMDIIHQAEYAFHNNSFPNDTDRLYLSMSHGSFKIKVFGKDGGVLEGLLNWLKELLDPRYRKLIDQEIESRDLKNKKLKAEIEVIPDQKKIELIQKEDELFEKRLVQLDRMVDISDKISKLSPDGRNILMELTKSRRDIADANDDGLIISISDIIEDPDITEDK